MDFFAAQEQARKQTRLLVAYFMAAVICIVVIINFALWFGLVAITEPPRQQPPLWDIERWLLTSVIVIAVILAASFIRTLQFRQGGGSVARSLGGKKVDASTRDPHEKRLVNVVEEMAIASGLPMPEIYILEKEEGINAFAAGLQTHDAAVAVTRGALEQLSRDELQGVIAHEFAHILNGDMRINVRLAGIIFGILVLALIGRGVLHSMYFSGARRGGGRNQNGGGAIVVVMIIGLTLLFVGLIGELFGRLIQAAISRRREYLADASAVQFTRNPDGIAGALKRIGAAHSRVENGSASGMAHFFFANAMKSSLSGAFSTHPPLPKRIRAVDPQWDGQYPRPGQKLPKSSPKQPSSRSGQRSGAGRRGLKTDQPIWDLAVMMGAIGSLDQRSIDGAHSLIESWPDNLREAVHQREGAKAVLLGLVVADSDSRDLSVLSDCGLLEEVTEQIDQLLPCIRKLTVGHRLPLAEVALGQLRELLDSEADQLENALVKLAGADGRESLFESCLLQLFRKQLRRTGNTGKVQLSAQIEGVSRILSRMVRLELDAGADADAFFARVSSGLRERWQSNLNRVDDPALDSVSPAEDFAILESLPLVVRGWVLEACIAAVIDNQSVSARESEWLRVIALTLDCPMPLLLPGQLEGQE